MIYKANGILGAFTIMDYGLLQGAQSDKKMIFIKIGVVTSDQCFVSF